MKIQNISLTHFTKQNTNNKQKNLTYSTNPMPYDTVSFTSFGRRKELTPEEKFERAMDIAESFTQDQIYDMDDFDQKAIDGIQYGLKTFEGMEFREIYFLLSQIKDFTFPLYRDCFGKCGPCYVNGRPEERNKNFLKRVDFEDFKNLTNDIKEIKKRLKYDYDKSTPIASFFYDSDSKDTWLTDKNGKVHYFPEINKTLHEAAGFWGLFDTAGWAPDDEIRQKRMEAVAQYYSDPAHADEIGQINISLNTYHGILMDANAKKAEGDLEGYERQKNHYIKNIANAMYTFTPLLNTSEYQIFRKCISDDEGEEFDDYKTEAFDDIQKKVLIALKEKYKNDFKTGNKKFVKSEKDIQILMDKQEEHFSRRVLNDITPNFQNELFSKLKYKNQNLIKNNQNASFSDVIQNSQDLVIDMNGKVYLTNNEELFKTDLQLNFKNKNKETKDLYPLPDKRIIRVKEKSFY